MRHNKSDKAADGEKNELHDESRRMNWNVDN